MNRDLYGYLPKELQLLSNKEIEDLHIRFVSYTKRNGNTIYFCWGYPDYGVEVVERIWEIDENMTKRRIFLFEYPSKATKGKWVRDSIPEHQWEGYLNYLGFSPVQVHVIDIVEEDSFKIKEFIPETKEKRDLLIPVEAALYAVKHQEFESTL